MRNRSSRSSRPPRSPPERRAAVRADRRLGEPGTQPAEDADLLEGRPRRPCRQGHDRHRQVPAAARAGPAAGYAEAAARGRAGRRRRSRGRGSRLPRRRAGRRGDNGRREGACSSAPGDPRAARPASARRLRGPPVDRLARPRPMRARARRPGARGRSPEAARRPRQTRPRGAARTTITPASDRIAGPMPSQSAIDGLSG